jgi:protein-S-isoprenylcysteine O-methyltransferase Ste14
LICSGPCRWVRHPIYSGLLLALFGTALALGNGRALLGLALIAAAAIRKLTFDEWFPSEQFGEEYARYCAQVPALVPRIF